MLNTDQRLSDSSATPAGGSASAASDARGKASGRAPFAALGAVAVALAAATAFYLAGLPSQTALVIAAALLAAAVVMRVLAAVQPHVVRLAHGHALVYNRPGADGAPIRVLRTGGVFQSATYLDERRFEPVFAYYRAFDAMFALEGAMRARSGHGIGRALMLGGGGFSWPKHALTAHDDLTVDVVELDPAVIDAARRWFFVDELARRVGAADGPAVAASLPGAGSARLGIICGDARAHLAKAAAGAAHAASAPRYDAIVNDLFTGEEPVLAMLTVEAARLVAANLAPGGLYLMNVVSRDDGADLALLRDQIATLAEVFRWVAVVPAYDEAYGGEDNYLLVASDAPYDLPDAIPFGDEMLGDVMRDADGEADS